MQRKALLIVIFGSLCLLLNAAVGITSVKMEDHSGAVCRVVIGFTAEAQYQLSETGAGLQLRVEDFDTGSKARIYSVSSKLVSGIEQQNERLLLSIIQPFRYETLKFNYPSRLAIDIFVDSPNKAQRLAIADFYSEMGKFNSADKAYHAMHTDYRNDAQVLYHWALLLAKRHSERLGDVVAKISESSSYYDRAHKLLARLHQDEEPLPAPPAEEKPTPQAVASPDTMSQTPEAALEDSSITPAPVAAAPVTMDKAKPDYRPVLLIVLIAMLFAVIYIMLNARKHHHHDPLDDEPNMTYAPDLESSTLVKMVSKLLDDGWTNKEIARELKISTAQVDKIIRQHRHGKGLDEL